VILYGKKTHTTEAAVTTSAATTLTSDSTVMRGGHVRFTLADEPYGELLLNADNDVRRLRAQVAATAARVAELAERAKIAADVDAARAWVGSGSDGVLGDEGVKLDRLVVELHRARQLFDTVAYLAVETGHAEYV
jgi:hypothetical protein